MKSDYSRSVSLICPTCACSSFEFDEGVDEELREHICTGCGANFRYTDLVTRNSSRVDAEMNALKNEVLGDIRKDIKKMFSGKNWKG